MSLANSLDALSDAGVDADRLQIIFISVDAERDTPQQLRDYLKLFNMDVVGLTGTAASRLVHLLRKLRTKMAILTMTIRRQSIYIARMETLLGRLFSTNPKSLFARNYKAF